MKAQQNSDMVGLSRSVQTARAAADRPAHLGVGDAVGEDVGAAVGACVGDGVGAAVGLKERTQQNAGISACLEVSTARMAADRPSHLGVGDAVGEDVGAAVGLNANQ